MMTKKEFKEFIRLQDKLDRAVKKAALKTIPKIERSLWAAEIHGNSNDNEWDVQLTSPDKSRYIKIFTNEILK